MKKNKNLVILVVLLGLAAAFFYFRHGTGTIRRELSEFAVEDTASIDKVFLADKMGNSVTLTREKPGRWKVNGKAVVRNDMINTLLETIKEVEVRSPVARAAFNNVMKKMAATSTKVEIYAGNRPVRVYYVGHETQDQYGTFMYLEHSSVPFVMHIPGFEGYLTTRYSAAEKDWVPNVVFDFAPEDIREILFDNREQPGNSFRIRRLEKGDYELATWPAGTVIGDAVQNKIISYLGFFSNLNYEFTARNLPEEKLDSILRASPFLVLTVTGTEKSTRATMYRMPMRRSREEMLDMGIVSDKPYDTDRFYLRLNDDDAMHAAQYFVFGKLFIGPESLR